MFCVKPKIYATGNENISGESNISYYILEKDDSFLDWLSKLLIEVFDMKDGEMQAKFFVKRKEDENGSWIGEEVFAKNIKKMVDLHEKYFKAGERVDVFYGKDRVYVTVRKSREIRKKFSEFLRKTKDWVVVKEMVEVPRYVGRQDGKESLVS